MKSPQCLWNMHKSVRCGKRDGAHKVCDKNAIFDVCVPNTRRQTRVSRCRHTRELACDIALAGVDLQQVWRSVHDDVKHRGSRRPYRERADVFELCYTESLAQ